MIMLRKDAIAGHIAPLRILIFGLLWCAIYILLDPFANWFTYNLLNLPHNSYLGHAIAFFVVDAPKVLILVVIITFIIGVIRTYLTPERIRVLLVGRKGIVGNTVAAIVGIPTPFCSCSAVPLFLGFLQSGVPIGVAMAFLISCPVVNEVALTLLFGLYGWKVAVLYAVTGMLIAIIGGLVIARIRPERWLESFVTQLQTETSGQDITEIEPLPFTWEDRIAEGTTAVREMLAGIWIYLVGGIALGALIYGYLPIDLVSRYLGKEWWNIPIVVVLGIPLYASAAGVIPIIQALLAKGAAFGTTLAFMMSLIGISFPELIMLRKVVRLPLILVFAAVVAIGSVVAGYMFNALI